MIRLDWCVVGCQLRLPFPRGGPGFSKKRLFILVKISQNQSKLVKISGCRAPGRFAIVRAWPFFPIHHRFKFQRTSGFCASAQSASSCSCEHAYTGRIGLRVKVVNTLLIINIYFVSWKCTCSSNNEAPSFKRPSSRETSNSNQPTTNERKFLAFNRRERSRGFRA